MCVFRCLFNGYICTVSFNELEYQVFLCITHQAHRYMDTYGLIYGTHTEAFETELRQHLYCLLVADDWQFVRLNWSEVRLVKNMSITR